ncbi:GntR family transcriptional regulator, partial [Armatimonas sp.]|uniref:GntR family transcriptional regulator n=1 Tax=Armatimonas sp. TaxID=1872638 RepID=UPI00286A9FCA
MSKTLSKFIADDLRINPPASEEPLTLTALATRYSVSLTPVRQAVRELIELGFLTKSATGRIHPGPSFGKGRVPRNEAGGSGAAGWVRDWEAELRTDVLQRSLRGDQEFLREEALAERLEIGRTVLRQALHQLAGQGFVEHVPRCGWRARELTLASVEDWLLVRERLELLALEQAWSHLDPKVLSQLRDGN